jgi:thermitase
MEKKFFKTLIVSSVILFGLILFITFTQAAVMANKNTKKKLPDSSAKNQIIQEINYVPGEVLVKFKEGSNPQSVLNEVDLKAVSLERLVPIQPITAKFKKESKLERTENGWYSFLGKNYKTAEDIPEEELFKQAYLKMPEVEKSIYRIYKLKLSKDKEVEEIVALLKKDPAVECAEPNYLSEILYTPNDPRFSEQWAHQKTEVSRAWDITKGNTNAIVAIIDTGVDYNHEDLAANMWRNNLGYLLGADFVNIDTAAYEQAGFRLIAGEDYTILDGDPSDYNGHGTHCAGIVAAVVDNAKGVAGVCPGCKIMPVRAGFSIKHPYYGEVGLLEVDDVTNAIVYAAHYGAKIISMSFGGPQSDIEKIAIDYAISKGVVLVAAAGNGSINDKSYPAGYEGVIAVAATAMNDTIAFYSNYGDWVAVSAPGGDYWQDSMILSAVPLTGTLGDPSGYRFLQGTSMAAPYVAGLAGLILSKNSSFTKAQIENQILATADNIDVLNSPLAGQLGAGRVNCYRALSETAGPNLKAWLQNKTIAMRPGETVNVVINLKNFGITATNITAALTTTNPYISVMKATSNFAALSSREQKDNANDPFRLAVHSDFPLSQDIALTLVITADGGYRDTLSLTLHGLRLKQGWPQTAENTGGWQAFADIVTEDLNNDGKLEIISPYVPVGTCTQAKIYAWNTAGELFNSGWPLPISGSAYLGSFPKVSAADICGDTNKEIIFTTSCEGIFALDMFGNVLTNWPKERGRDFNSTGATLADLNNDGKAEVIACSRRTDVEPVKLWVWNGNGDILTGWPKNLTHGISGNIAVGDLDRLRDPVTGNHPEIIVSSTTTNGQERSLDIFAYNYLGDLLWSYHRAGDFFGCSLILGDINADGYLEIIYNVTKDVYSGMITESLVGILNWEGRLISEFPARKMLELSLADLNSDGIPEIIGASNTASAFGNDYLYAWDIHGQNINGFPREGNFMFETITTDINGDGSVDILGNNSDNIYAWDCSGNPLPNYSVTFGNLLESIAGTGLVVKDIDNDGAVEIVATTDHKIYVFAAGGFSAQSNAWPMRAHDSQRTACYTPPESSVLPSPTNLAATGGARNISLSWQYHSINLDRFSIKRSSDGNNFSAIAEVNGASRSYQDLNLPSNTNFYYKINALKDNQVSGFSNTAQATTLATQPLAPSALTAVAVSGNQINLTWRDNSNDESYFVIERWSPDAPGRYLLRCVPAKAGSGQTYAYNDKFAIYAGYTYRYAVYAYNTAGRSNYSNQVVLDTPYIISVNWISLRLNTSSPSVHLKISASNIEAFNNASKVKIYNSADSSSSIATTQITRWDTNAGYIECDAPRLASGYYYLRVHNSKGRSRAVRVRFP